MANDQTIQSNKKPMRSRLTLCIYNGEQEEIPVHPVMVGVFRWLKVNAKAALADPTVPWNGALQDYDWLKAGEHHDPCPGRIITPEDPENFDVELLKRPWADLSPEEEGIATLEDRVELVDLSVWDDMEEVLRITPTRERYAELTIKYLDRALDMFVLEDQAYQEQQQAELVLVG